MQQSLLPLKDANGNALTLPRINQGSNYPEPAAGG